MASPQAEMASPQAEMRYFVYFQYLGTFLSTMILQLYQFGSPDGKPLTLTQKCTCFHIMCTLLCECTPFTKMVHFLMYVVYIVCEHCPL